MDVDPAIEAVWRGAFLLLFASAVTHKLVHFQRFRLTVEAYLRATPFAAAPAAALVSVIVIAIEFAAIVACVAPIDPMLRAGIICGALLIYAAAMGLNLMRGNALLDCGCSLGAARQPVGAELVGRNIIMAVLALPLALPSSLRPLGSLDLVSISIGIPLIALMYATTNGLILNASRQASTR